MKKSIKIFMAGMLIVPMLALFSVFTPAAPTASAATCEGGKTIADGLACTKPKDGEGSTCLFGVDKDTGKDCAFTGVTNAALYLIGAVSVLMLIYGGIMYTISAGDSAKVTTAKNTIFYAVVGIVVAVLSYAIVNFVITNLVN